MDLASHGNPPAGFFSTFSVLDLNGNSREGPARVQKRNRRVFVCIPCHQRKLKCDKGRPCSRCVRSGTRNECVYQPLPSTRKSRQGSSSSATEPDDYLKPGLGQSPASSCSDGRTRLHGVTHWRSIASEFEEAWPYIVGSDFEWQPRHRQIKDLGCLFSTLPGISFPLGDSYQYSRGRQQVLAILPPRQLIETLVQCYFAAFEPTHRLIHPREFYGELNAFWVDHDHPSDSWLSQLCMMLALGCRAAPLHIFRGSGRSMEEWTDLLLDADQFFYGGSPNSITPSLTTIRSLCLAVMARTMDIVKGTTVTQLVSLMGMTIRLAMTMHLHRTTSLFPEIPAFEAEMRKRVWVTIQLLDLDIAMRTGGSYICRDHDADTPLNLDDTDIPYSERGWRPEAIGCAVPNSYTESSFQIKLSGLLPLLAEIINTINSPTQQNIEPSRIKTWTTQLQQKLKEAEDELCRGQHLRPEMADKITTQKQFLHVLVHRTLMAMNHQFIAAPQGSHRSPTAIQTVIKSAVLLLRTQQIWYSGPQQHHQQRPRQTLSVSVGGMPVHSRSPSPMLIPSTQTTTTTPAPTPKHMTSWLVDLCHDDFGAAMLYIMLALRNHDVDTVPNDKQGIPSRAEIWSILRQSLAISGERARQSISHFKEFTGLSIAAACLRSMDTGEFILPLLQDVAAEIERRVLFEGGGGGGVRQEGGMGGVHTVDVGGHGHHGHVWGGLPETSVAGGSGQHLVAGPVDFPTDLFEFGYG